MFQKIQGRNVYVVEFEEMPELPIRSETAMLEPYAKALHSAIVSGVVTKPGKYAIEIIHGMYWNIWNVEE